MRVVYTHALFYYCFIISEYHKISIISPRLNNFVRRAGKWGGGGGGVELIFVGVGGRVLLMLDA